jgi:phosphatidylinositol-3-phosphatase
VRFATQYYGVTHPSLPNYLALIAGDEMGIHDDCKAGADIKCKPEEFVPNADESAEAGHLLTGEEERKAADMAHLFPGRTLIDQLDEAKVTWKVYMQGLPADRKTVEYWPLDADGKVVAKLYAQKHNPFVYFSDFAGNPDRMAKLLPDDGLAADLKGDLAGFTWLSPDQCHDMHGISAKSAAVIGAPNCGDPASGLDHSVIRLGDDYLRQTVEAIRSSARLEGRHRNHHRLGRGRLRGGGRPKRQSDRPQRRGARRRARDEQGQSGAEDRRAL